MISGVRLDLDYLVNVVGFALGCFTMRRTLSLGVA